MRNGLIPKTLERNRRNGWTVVSEPILHTSEGVVSKGNLWKWQMLMLWRRVRSKQHSTRRNRNTVPMQSLQLSVIVLVVQGVRCRSCKSAVGHCLWNVCQLQHVYADYEVGKYCGASLSEICRFPSSLVLLGQKERDIKTKINLLLVGGTIWNKEQMK